MHTLSLERCSPKLGGFFFRLDTLHLTLCLIRYYEKRFFWRLWWAESLSYKLRRSAVEVRKRERLRSVELMLYCMYLLAKYFLFSSSIEVLGICSCTRVATITVNAVTQNESEAEYENEQSIRIILRLISPISANVKDIRDRSRRIELMSVGDHQVSPCDFNLHWYLPLLWGIFASKPWFQCRQSF